MFLTKLLTPQLFTSKPFTPKQLRFLAAAVTAATLTTVAACSKPTVSPGEVPPAIETTSSPAEVALAEHLTSIGAKKYGAWWCPHCHAQQALFGAEAFEKVTYVECDAEGQNAQPSTCQVKGVQSFPTWEINGELYPGVQSLETLATISEYSGPTTFQNQLEQ
ncbi:MAG: hypothetical protein AAF152_17570 [Cyanobacteria bacterium P01_A01_bin.114]